MKDVEITVHGAFQVATARSKTGFTSWAKKGEIQADCPIKEPGNDVWFGFGSTRDEARKMLLDELGLDEAAIRG